MEGGEEAADRRTVLVAPRGGVARADALEHEDAFRHLSVGGATQLTAGRSRRREQAGELALGEHVGVAAVAERRLAPRVELLMPGGEDKGADGQILLPWPLTEVDGAGRAGLLAGAAFRAATAGEAAPSLGQRLLLGESQTDLLPARPALLGREHPHLLARPGPAPAEIQVRDLGTVPLHRPDVEQGLAPQMVVDAPSRAGTGRDR